MREIDSLRSAQRATESQIGIMRGLKMVTFLVGAAVSGTGIGDLALPESINPFSSTVTGVSELAIGTLILSTSYLSHRREQVLHDRNVDLLVQIDEQVDL